MSAEHQTKPPSGELSPSWQMLAISLLARIDAKLDVLISTARPTGPTTPPPPRRSGRMKDRFAKVVIYLRWTDIKKLYEAWRNGPWGLLGLALWALAKWLGLL